MQTYWHKDRWWPGDLVPPFGTPAIWALPLGIYCEDEAAKVVLLKGASETCKSVDVDWGAYGLGCSLAGTPVYVATPAQAELLRAMPARSPDEALAEQKAATDAMIAKIDQLMALVEPRPAAPPPATRHPFRGANRKAKRAAAAKARRRA